MIKGTKILKILLSVLILHICISLSYIFIVIKKHPDSNQAKELIESRNQIKYLFLGDSRLQNALQECSNEKKTIYTSRNENYIYSYYKLKYLLEHGVKPEYLVLQLDLYSFTNYKNQVPKPSVYWVSKADYKEIASYRNGSEYWYAIQGCLIPYLSTKQYKSFSIITVNGLESEADIKIASFFKDGFYMDFTMLTYFEKIVELCDSQNIKMILISLPLSSYYLNQFSLKVTDIEEYLNVELVIEKYPNIVAAFGYQNEFIENNKFFINSDHLNKEGSLAFSKKLMNDLLALEI